MVDSTDRSPPGAGRGEFTELYCGLAPALHVWAALRLRPQLRAFCDLEDLLQEVWCRAYAIRDRFDPDEVAFRPWLFRVAKNVLLEVVRKARYASQVKHPEGRTTRLFTLEAVADQVTSVTRRVARDDSLREFHGRIDALPEDERELVLHLGLEGLGYDEVARRLDLNREAVKKRWQRLRARLEGQGVPDTLLELA